MSVLEDYARQLAEYALRNYTAKVGGALADGVPTDDLPGAGQGFGSQDITASSGRSGVDTWSPADIDRRRQWGAQGEDAMFRDLGWDDFWSAVAVSLFVTAVVIWADYITSLVEIASAR